MSLSEFDVGDIVLTDFDNEISKLIHMLSYEEQHYTHVGIVTMVDDVKYVAELNFGRNVTLTPLEDYFNDNKFVAFCIRKLKPHVRQHYKHRIINEIHRASKDVYERRPQTLAMLVMNKPPDHKRTGKICTEYVVDILAKSGLFRIHAHSVLPDFFLTKDIDESHDDPVCLVYYDNKPALR